MKTSRDISGLTAWVAASFSAGLAGARSMPGEWYEALAKPSWNPPNWVFGPVWTALYIMMGTAAWRVWRRDGFRDAGIPLTLFSGHLVLNALWSYLFFGIRRPDVAFYEILALLAAIVTVGVMFWRRDRAAGLLMVPYALWVAFATFLNLTLWRMNP